MISRMAHISFTVSDLERSMCFYRDLLGFKVEWQAERSGPSIDAIFGVGVRYKIVRLTLDDFNLDLMQCITPVGEKLDLKTNSIGCAHLAFFVKNMEETYKFLLDKGVQFKSKPVQLKDGPIVGWKVVFFSDPDGIILEVMERP